ncbi:GlsB/YeaQ/YmgE family stress response membrane protein [Pengzhenrongella phosphoraccumulans]|uniref:GlsB/YeaQ/YmgE family stress response membrane protein n=1 Tax=Pengzhenrongella phosphoraccumulans TaxID=3114394 RepID=UPI00388EC850
MAIVSAIFVGAFIGALGRLFARGRQNISVLVTIIVGIIAALLGTALARLLGVADTWGIDWIELAIQVVLAVVGVTFAAQLLGKRTSASS